MNEHLDPRTFRDDAYPNITLDVVSPSGMPAISIPCKCTPPTNDGSGQVEHDPTVWIASDESDDCHPQGLSEQEVIAKGRKGDLMDGVPSILLQIEGKKYPLTWAEAYNLGRALIDKANEAFYG